MMITTLLLPSSSFDFQPKFPSFSSRFPKSSTNELGASIAYAAAVPQAVKQVSSTSLSHLTSTRKADSLLLFLKQRGFSDVQLERFMNCSNQVLSASIENIIEPKLKILQDFGFSASEIAEIISKDPLILNCSASKITASLCIYKSLLGSNGRLVKFLRSHKWLFYAVLEETLVPNVEFLKTCGIPMVQIINHLFVYPYFLLIKPENMVKFVNKADEMGVKRASKMFIYALHVVSSMSDETWKLKLKAFEDFGFSEEDITRMLRSSPHVFRLSEQKIEKVKEVLLQTGKYDMSCIVNYPISLSYSVENRYKPRLQVLKILEKKKLIERWPSLSTLALMPNKTFSERFLEPYTDELGETIITRNVVSYKSKCKAIRTESVEVNS